MFSLEGKKAFITGGTSGIGRAVAERFIKAGAEVVIVGRREEGVSIAKDIGATFYQADVTQEEKLIAALQHAEQQLGKLDILINNAGLDNNGPLIEEQDLTELRRCFSLNFDAMYALFIHGPKHMSDGGSIVVTSSVAGGFVDLPTYSQYSASKAALTSLVRSAALELAPRSIRVNAISAGPVATRAASGLTHFEELLNEAATKSPRRSSCWCRRSSCRSDSTWHGMRTGRWTACRG